MASVQRYLPYPGFMRETERRVDQIPLTRGKYRFGAAAPQDYPAVGPVGMEIRNMTGQIYLHPRTAFGEVEGGVPMPFQEQPIQPWGNGGGVSAWSTVKGGPPLTAELNTISGQLANFGYTRLASTPDINVHLQNIISGAVSHALTRIAPVYTIPASTPAVPIGIPIEAWKEKMAFSIGVVRMVISAWSAYSLIIPGKPSTWWVPVATTPSTMFPSGWVVCNADLLAWTQAGWDWGPDVAAIPVPG